MTVLLYLKLSAQLHLQSLHLTGEGLSIESCFFFTKIVSVGMSLPPSSCLKWRRLSWRTRNLPLCYPCLRKWSSTGPQWSQTFILWHLTCNHDLCGSEIWVTWFIQGIGGLNFFWRLTDGSEDLTSEITLTPVPIFRSLRCRKTPNFPLPFPALSDS